MEYVSERSTFLVIRLNASKLNIPMNQDNDVQGASGTPRGFDEMDLAEPILKAVRSAGYDTPSPIQECAIPPILEGKDLLGVAQTGTGKTAAFSLPLLSRMDESVKGAQILVLAPTRELALQVAEAMEGFAENLPKLRVVAVYGGTGYGEQIKEFKRGTQVVVGTPGRVMDHIEKGYLKLDHLQALVLDEADEMLSMGFIDDIKWILEHTPTERQTALFSATMPKPIQRLAENYMQDPVKITIKVKAENSPNIRQRFIKVRQYEKREMMIRLLEIEKFDGLLVFARTKNATMEIAEVLQGKGYPAEPLNGDMPQSLREKTVDRLKRGKINILVATDVAARGLDVDRISHVLNFDAPFDLESYTHRIGRTGRAGREGDAIIFVTGKEVRMLKAIERTLKVPCDEYIFPTLEEMNERREEEFFSQIEEGMKGDLGDYRKALQRLLEETSKDTLDIAAALAFLAGGKKPLFYDSMPKIESKRSRREDRRDRRDRGEGKKFSSGDNDRSERKSFRDDHLQSYRLEVGEYHGAQKGDIVGAIANEVGLDPQHMGKIRMFKDHTFIDLPKDMPPEIFEALKSVWVQGHQMNISIDKGRPRPGGKGGKFRKSFGKGGKKFSKGKDFKKKSKPRFRS